jgi:DNA-binding LacI/PurR family transcriptional regulator
VVTFNDDSALGMLDAFIRAGVAVPDDLSIVGYDDSWVSRLSCINLTTVGQDADRMAALAVDRAIARLDGQAAREREIVLPPYLVVRGTTAAPSRRAVPLRRARAR